MSKPSDEFDFVADDQPATVVLGKTSSRVATNVTSKTHNKQSNKSPKSAQQPKKSKKAQSPLPSRAPAEEADEGDENTEILPIQQQKRKPKSKHLTLPPIVDILSSSNADKDRGILKLKFNQRLVSKSGKLELSQLDLSSALQKLFAELRDMDQEVTDLSTLAIVTKELASKCLLRHKEKSIRHRVACCIADILRIYAPDAPYNPQELKEIFDVFIAQFEELAKPDAPGYEFHHFLLESLSTVKSIILINDLDTPHLVVKLFRTLFKSISSSHSSEEYLLMLDIMRTIVDESEHLPSDALEVVLSQLLKKKQEENPKAYAMARDLILTTSSKLQRPVGHYFTEILAHAGSNLLDEDDDEKPEISTLMTAHSLVTEIHKAEIGKPYDSVLLTVYSQLQFELRVTDVKRRKLGFHALGEMFSFKGSRLAKEFPHIWDDWCQRKGDTDVSIRLALVAFVPKLLKNQPTLCDDVLALLSDKLQDNDERVRILALNTIGDLDHEGLRCLTKKLVRDAGERCIRDAKLPVRQEAAIALSKIYVRAFCEQDPEIHKDDFNSIPENLVSMVNISGDDWLCFIKCLSTYIFPWKLTAMKISERLLTFFSMLSPNSTEHIFGILMRYKSKNSKSTLFLSKSLDLASTKTEAEKIQLQKLTENVAKSIAATLPDQVNVQAQLMKLRDCGDVRLLKALLELISPSMSYESISTFLPNLLKRLIAPGFDVDIFRTFISSSTTAIMNVDLIPHLVEQVRQPDNTFCTPAKAFLLKLSKIQPAIFVSSADDFLEMIESDDAEIVRFSLKILKRIFKFKPGNIVLEGMKLNYFLENVTCADIDLVKCCVVILACSKNRQDNLKVIYNLLISELYTRSNSRLFQIHALRKIAKYSLPTFETKAAEVIEFLTKEIILLPIDEKQEEEWQELSQIPITGQVKVAALKLLLARLNTMLMSNDSLSYTSLAKPLLRLLFRLIGQKGALSEEDTTPETIKAHIRLTSAIGLFRLARFEAIEQYITPDFFNRLSLIVQDLCFEVRHAAVQHLLKNLSSNILPVRYLTFLFLTAHDPAVSISNSVLKSIAVFKSREANGPRKFMVESVLSRLIHLLAHHPDFESRKSVDDLKMFETYVRFFVNAVADASNVSYLFYVAQRIKVMEDKTTPDRSEYMYALSDLFQLVLREKAGIHTWAIDVCNLDAVFPSELMGWITDPKKSKSIAKKSFLPSDFTVSTEKKHHHHHASVIGTKRKVTEKPAPQSPAKKSNTRRSKTVESEVDESSEDERAIIPRMSRAERLERRVANIAISETSNTDEDKTNAEDMAVDSQVAARSTLTRHKSTKKTQDQSRTADQEEITKNDETNSGEMTEEMLAEQKQEEEPVLRRRRRN